jgi:hypothetical protein
MTASFQATLPTVISALKISTSTTKRSQAVPHDIGHRNIFSMNMDTPWGLDNPDTAKKVLFIY